MPGIFKLDHLHPFKPLLFWKFSIIFTFILGGQFLLPQRSNNGKREFIHPQTHLPVTLLDIPRFYCHPLALRPSSSLLLKTCFMAEANSRIAEYPITSLVSDLTLKSRFERLRQWRERQNIFRCSTLLELPHLSRSKVRTSSKIILM